MKDTGDTYEKPRVFRDRKKTSKKLPLEQQELHHPAHKPYERERTNWTHNVVVDGLGEEDGSD